MGSVLEVEGRKMINQKRSLSRGSFSFRLSGQKDSNLRPPAPKAGALAGLRHTPKKKTIRHRLLSFAEKGGFEPPVPIAGYDSLANCWFQPLTHLSVVRIAVQKYDFFRYPQTFFAIFLSKTILFSEYQYDMMSKFASFFSPNQPKREGEEKKRKN